MGLIFDFAPEHAREGWAIFDSIEDECRTFDWTDPEWEMEFALEGSCLDALDAAEQFLLDAGYRVVEVKDRTCFDGTHGVTLTLCRPYARLVTYT